MNKRRFLDASLCLGLGLLPGLSRAQDQFGESLGFPSGWGPPGQRQKWEGYPEYHVGNFSGGMENLFAHRRIQAGAQSTPFLDKPRQVRAGWGPDAASYVARFNRSGLLIVRDGEIWHEEYRFKRQADMRFFGWSMTKSVVGLLTGIALEQGKLASIDAPVERLVPRLSGHAFADITLRNLLNMTSGIDICEAFCSPNNGFERFGHSQIGHSPRRGQDTDQVQAVLDFKWGRSDPQGQRFNYTEINPLLVAWALETAYQQPLHLIAQQHLWQPLGAQADATWLVDAKGFTFSGAGISATLRDWARLGLLVANDGRANGRQVVPAAWIEETSRHGDKDQAARFNLARPGRGYRNFFWHHSADGRMLRMAGNLSQNVLLDRKTKTVLVQTGVSSENGGDEAMSTLFAAACQA